jgi:hypothetical protein
MNCRLFYLYMELISYSFSRSIGSDLLSLLVVIPTFQQLFYLLSLTFVSGELASCARAY